MKRLIWTRRAVKDVTRLSDFLVEKNPDAARRAADTIREGVKILRDQAEIGRPIAGLGSGFREWTIRFGSGFYIVRYWVQDSEVILLAIRHGREAGY